MHFARGLHEKHSFLRHNGQTWDGSAIKQTGFAWGVLRSRLGFGSVDLSRDAFRLHESVFGQTHSAYRVERCAKSTVPDTFCVHESAVFDDVNSSWPRERQK